MSYSHWIDIVVDKTKKEEILIGLHNLMLVSVDSLFSSLKDWKHIQDANYKQHERILSTPGKNVVSLWEITFELSFYL